MEIQGNTTTLASVVSGHKDVQPSDVEKARSGGSDPLAGGRSDSAGEARVALSGRARGMLAIKQAVEQAPDVREVKVAELKTQVAAGTYDVRGQLVAEAMARHTLVEAVA